MRRSLLCLGLAHITHNKDAMLRWLCWNTHTLRWAVDYATHNLKSCSKVESFKIILARSSMYFSPLLSQNMCEISNIVQIVKFRETLLCISERVLSGVCLIPVTCRGEKAYPRGFLQNGDGSILAINDVTAVRPLPDTMASGDDVKGGVGHRKAKAFLLAGTGYPRWGD